MRPLQYLDAGNVGCPPTQDKTRQRETNKQAGCFEREKTIDEIHYQYSIVFGAKNQKYRATNQLTQKERNSVVRQKLWHPLMRGQSRVRRCDDSVRCIRFERI